MGVFAQALLHEDYIVQRRENCEEKSGAQENCTGDPDPADGVNFKQQHEEDGADLREGIRFPKDARPKIAEAGDGEQDRAGCKDRDVAAEDEYGVFPWNFVQDGEHQEHGAEQKFVRDGVEVLSEESLLMESAG